MQSRHWHFSADVPMICIMLTYRTGNDLDLDAVLDLYRSCSLRRPTDDRDRMRDMIRHANLVITAWDDALLVGISRAFTDFAYATYLSDLAVRESHQRRGIGKQLIRLTQSAAPLATVILLAAPNAVDYYPRIGFTQHPSAWRLKPGEAVI